MFKEENKDLIYIKVIAFSFRERMRTIYQYHLKSLENAYKVRELLCPLNKKSVKEI